MSEKTSQNEVVAAPEAIPTRRPLEAVSLFLACFGVAAGLFIPSSDSAFAGRLMVDFLLLLAAVTAALSSLLYPRAIGHRRRCLDVALPLAAFAGLLAASTLRAAYRHEAAWGLFNWVSLISFALLTHHLASRPENRALLLAALLAAAAVLTAHAIRQRYVDIPASRAEFEADPPGVMRKLGLTPDLYDEMKGRLSNNYPYATFVLSTSLAGFLALMIPLFAAATMSWLKRGTALPVYQPTGKPAAAAGAATLAAVATLFLTGSKGGLLAFGAAAAAFVLIVWHRSILAHKLKAGLVAVAIVAAAALLHLAPFAPRGEKYLDSLDTRLPYWRASVESAMARPWLGIGLGSWQDDYTRLKGPEAQEAKAAHEDYLQLAAEAGIPCLLAYLLTWLTLLRRARRPLARSDAAGISRRVFIPSDYLLAGVAAGLFAVMLEGLYTALFPSVGGQIWLWPLLLWGVWSGFFLLGARTPWNDSLLRAGALAGVIGFLAHGLVDFDLQVEGLAQTAFCLIAIAVAIPESSDISEAAPTGRSPGVVRGGLILALLAGAAAIGIFYVWPLSRAESCYSRAKRYDPEMTAAQRRELLLEALRLAPSNAEYQGALAEIHLRAAFDRAAPGVMVAEEGLAAARRAIELRPTTYGYYMLLGEICALNGRRADGAEKTGWQKQALENYLAASELYPGNAPLALRIAQAEYELGDYKRARRAYARALDLDARQYHHIRGRLSESDRELARKRAGAD